MIEAVKNFKAPQVSISDLSQKIQSLRKPAHTAQSPPEEIKSSQESKNSEKIDKTQTEPGENPTKSEPSAHTETETETANSKTPPLTLRDKIFTRLEVATKSSPRIGQVLDYSTELWKETFPRPEDKLEKLRKLHEMRKLSREIDEKIQKGEISQEDIPEWKRSALVVLPPKLSRWEKLKNKFSGTKLSSAISDKTSDLMSSEQVKQVRVKIQEIKEGITEIKEVAKDSLEDSDSKMYQSAKSAVYNSFLETPEAKAVKIMRQSDPDFDIYVMELELTGIVRKVLDKALQSDLDYVKKTAEGSALEYLSHVNDKVMDDVTLLMSSNVIFVSKCTYLGLNFEDKTAPKFSYSFKAKYSVNYSLAQGEEEGDEGVRSMDRGTGMGLGSNVHEYNYFVTFTAHPDPDVLTLEHPWLFLAFYPAEDNQRLNNN